MMLTDFQRLQIESTLRQYHQDVSNALMYYAPVQLAQIEAQCIQTLEQAELYTSEVHREIDGMAQRMLFDWLANGHGALSAQQIREICRRHLGEEATWLEQYRRFRQTGTAIVLAVLTWQCEMRCTYCSIPKQSGREISNAVLDAAGELLLSAPQDRLEMRYFGGEPLLEWEKLQYSIATLWNTQQCSTKCQNKTLSFLITTNGMKLDEEKAAWMSQYPVSLQLALDGLPDAQDRYRVLYQSDESSYAHCAIEKAELLHRYDIPHTVIIVVHPARIEHMLADFQHIVEKGFEVIQINWAHNTIWHPQHLKGFAEGLHQLSDCLHQRWAQNQGPLLLNLKEVQKKVRTSREITVDWDGQIYANNGFLFRPHIQEQLRLGDVSDGRNWLHYCVDYFSNAELDATTHAEKVFDNNAKVGMVFNSWIRWMVQQGIPDVTPFISNRYR